MPAGGDNLTFAGDHLSSRSNDDGDVRLHIGISSLTYRGDTPFFDAKIGLHDSAIR